MASFDLTPYRLTDGRLLAFSSYGSYPLVYITADGGDLCAGCAHEEGSTDDDAEKQWRIIGVDPNWEDPDRNCTHCHERIESAYAEDEVA